MHENFGGPPSGLHDRIDFRCTHGVAKIPRRFVFHHENLAKHLAIAHMELVASVQEYGGVAVSTRKQKVGAINFVPMEWFQYVEMTRLDVGRLMAKVKIDAKMVFPLITFEVRSFHHVERKVENWTVDVETH